MYSRSTPMRTPARPARRRSSRTAWRHAADAERRELVFRIVARDHVEDPRDVLTVRQIGPTRSFMNEAGIMPSRLTSSCVGDKRRRCCSCAGLRDRRARLLRDCAGDEFAATAEPEPPLERPGDALGVVRVAERAAEGAAVAAGVLAHVGFGDDDRARFAQPLDEGRVVRRPVVRVDASAPDVVRRSNVSNWSLIAMTTPCNGPTSSPVRAKASSSAAATSSASGIPGSSSAASVMLRALRASNSTLERFRTRFSVVSALICPALAMVVTGPRIPCGSFTHRPLNALMRVR